MQHDVKDQVLNALNTTKPQAAFQLAKKLKIDEQTIQWAATDLARTKPDIVFRQKLKFDDAPTVRKTRWGYRLLTKAEKEEISTRANALKSNGADAPPRVEPVPVQTGQEFWVNAKLDSIEKTIQYLNSEFEALSRLLRS